MKSVVISYNFTSEQIHDEYRPKTDKDLDRFITRMKNDRLASPASDIKAFRFYEDGRMELISA